MCVCVPSTHRHPTHPSSVPASPANAPSYIHQKVCKRCCGHTNCGTRDYTAVLGKFRRVCYLASMQCQTGYEKYVPGYIVYELVLGFKSHAWVGLLRLLLFACNKKKYRLVKIINLESIVCESPRRVRSSVGRCISTRVDEGRMG